MASITRLKFRLSHLIEPDFGLLDHLLSLHVLTLRQFVEVRGETTACKRNDTLLDLLTSVDQCDKFLIALQRTGQQLVANFVTENGGQRECSYKSLLIVIETCCILIAVKLYWTIAWTVSKSENLYLVSKNKWPLPAVHSSCMSCCCCHSTWEFNTEYRVSTANFKTF